MRNISRSTRTIIFIAITIMVIGILGALIIPVSSFTNGGIAAIISTTLFIIYLVVVDYFFDKKGWSEKDLDN